MLIEQGDGTAIGGPLDVICLLQDVNTGRFHPCFIEEYPFPNDDEDLVELQVMVSVSLRPVTVRLPRELTDKVMGGEVGRFDEIAEADANGGWDNFLDMFADKVAIDDATVVAPGPIKDSTAPGPVRLKSRMHYSVGADTLEGGLKLLEELTKMILLEPGNVLREPVRWNGVIGFVLVMDNWRAEGGLPLQIKEAAG